MSSSRECHPSISSYFATSELENSQRNDQVDLTGDSELQQYELLFPALSKLLVRGLVLPIATADCERGFSAMNRIKTVPRNRLKTNTLEQLMFISIEGPSADRFDFGRAADKWGGLHHRRIHWHD